MLKKILVCLDWLIYGWCLSFIKHVVLMELVATVVFVVAQWMVGGTLKKVGLQSQLEVLCRM